MVIWWFVFGISIFMTMISAWLFFRQKSNAFMVLAALGSFSSSLVSAGMGIYGLIHIEELSRRSGFDFKFEENGWLLAFAAVLFNVGWLIIGRKLSNVSGWVSLASSCWMFLVWTAVCSTF